MHRNKDLFEAECGVSSCNALPLMVAERVEHAVMRVHRRQAILLQLILNDLHQFLHTHVIAAPITHNLHNERAL